MTSTETLTPRLTRERADLLESLARHRFFLRFTARGLTDEQAAERPTASALCVGGLIKHVAETEKMWMEFAVGGGQAMAGGADAEVDWNSRFDMAPGDTLAGVLETYDAVARRTDELVATLDLDADYPLPEAPWFEPGARWSVRRVVLHVIAETSQHAGHADIIRETIDGQKTMG
jgi:uncharacterized damage-inducible protein DinB